MNDLDVILAKANISLSIDQLGQWNDKKKNERTEQLIEILTQSFATFNQLEKEYLIARQRASEMAVELMKKDREIEEKTQEIKELKELLSF